MVVPERDGGADEGDRGLVLHDTMARAKRPFRPIDPRCVRMYVCGPTVYDDAHVGNARPLIVFDLLFRLLRHLYGPCHVTYVRNVTDVDDKINARAAERGVSIRALTEETLARFHEDVKGLHCLPPTFEPRATEHVEEMKAMIERLVAAGHAYVNDGHVLFDVASFPAYGALSGRPLEEMRAGARVEVAPYKRGELDFVLWKPSDPARGEPAWPSPCGIAAPGRPGWHLECSAMSDLLLWERAKDRLSQEARALPHRFDIHGGGIDLSFPHHENERAQTCAAHGVPAMANWWLHNGFLQVEGRKMSKSEGNFVTIRELLADWPGETVRLAMLRTHYRQPIDWTVKGLEESQRNLEDWAEVAGEAAAARLDEEAMDALLDDLNTPRAIAALHKCANDGRTEALSGTAALLGIDLSAVAERTAAARRRRLAGVGVDVAASVRARLEAKKRRDFAEADRIRDELAARGIVLKDGKDPATGEPVTTWEVSP